MDMLTTKEAAKETGVGIRTIQRLCESGQLPSQAVFERYRLIRRADLRYVATRRKRGEQNKKP